MEACLLPEVSCRLINDNHQAENERYWRNRKNKKYTVKRTLGLCTTLYVYVYVCVCMCLGRLYLRIIVYWRLSDI